MKRTNRFGLLSAIAISCCIGANGTAVSQDGSGSSRSAPSRATRPQTPEEFYSNFWRYVAKPGAAYNTWKVLASENADEGVANPHGKTSRTYADKSAADDPMNLPIGSILVREDHDENGKRQSISVIYRVKDYDKDHGNWYWLKYLENGAVVRGPDNKVVAGKVTSCIECHAKAKDKDFVFSNDGLSSEKATGNNASPTASDTKAGKKE